MRDPAADRADGKLMRRLQRACGLGMSLLLAACVSAPVTPPPAPEPPPAPPQPPAVVDVPEDAAPVTPPPPVAVAEPPAATRALQFYSQLRGRAPREQRLEQERLRKSFAASRSEHDRVRLALTYALPGASPADELQALELLEPLVRDSRSEYHDLATLVSGLLAEQRRRGEQAAALQHKLERIKALEREMLERSTAREARPR
jgi:hypothetical protein